MTPKETDQYFTYHNANIKLLKIGFDNIRDHIKALYHRTDNQGAYIFTLGDQDPAKFAVRHIEVSYFRLLAGIQVSWAEECFKRILYEKGLFTDAQRNFLLTRSSLEQKWFQTLKIVFSIAYDLVPAGDEICDTVNIRRERRNLGDDLVDQYLELNSIITNYLAPNFRIRNKVQHGEWVYAFEPPNSAVYSQQQTDNLNQENIITTTSRYTLVNAFYQMIVDMGRFRSNAFALDSIQTPFEYFYKDYMKKISYEVMKINNPDLDGFIREIIARAIRGQQHRAARVAQS
jgi:hypothetical protein